MPTKHITASLQAMGALGKTTRAIIKIDGQTKFDDYVENTGITIDHNDPSVSIIFDHDVPEIVAPVVYPDPGIFVTQTVEISAIDGTIKLNNLLANHSGVFLNQGTTEQPDWVWIPGGVSENQIIDIISQPLWDGQALLIRYNIEYNQGPIAYSGPGEVVIYNGETVSFNVAMPKFSGSV